MQGKHGWASNSMEVLTAASRDANILSLVLGAAEDSILLLVLFSIGITMKKGTPDWLGIFSILKVNMN